MKNKKKKNEFFMETEQGTLDGKKNNEDKEKKSLNSSISDSNEEIAGLNDKFPEEKFIELESKQGFRKIKLHTYRYPAMGNLKGIIYLL